jgi:glycogen debranching enzyme
MSAWLSGLEIKASKRLQKIFRPKLAAQMCLVDAEAECESAKQARAMFFAAQLFQETMVLLRCARETFREGRFEETKVLALLARRKAAHAVDVAEKTKLESRMQLQRQMEHTLTTLSEARRLLLRSPASPPTGNNDGYEELFQKALADLLNASQSLGNDDFTTASAHLGYARALTERLKSRLHDRVASDATTVKGAEIRLDSFPKWFVDQLKEIQQLDPSARFSGAHNAFKIDSK